MKVTAERSAHGIITIATAWVGRSGTDAVRAVASGVRPRWSFRPIALLWQGISGARAVGSTTSAAGMSEGVVLRAG